MINLIDASKFLRVVEHSLADANADAESLAQAVLGRWTVNDVRRLVSHADVPVRQAAVLALGLIGDVSDSRLLALQLRDPNPPVHQTAEHALWSLWFRGGRPGSASGFQEGVTLLAAEQYDQAIDTFSQVIRTDPGFAEAYNQRGICLFLKGDYENAGLNCCRTIHLLPFHFGALAGLGHCYAELGDLSKALFCYRKALHVNPNLTAIAQAISRLSDRVADVDEPASVLSMDP